MTNNQLSMPNSQWLTARSFFIRILIGGLKGSLMGVLVGIILFLCSVLAHGYHPHQVGIIYPGGFFGFILGLNSESVGGTILKTIENRIRERQIRHRVMSIISILLLLGFFFSNWNYVDYPVRDLSILALVFIPILIGMSFLLEIIIPSQLSN